MPVPFTIVDGYNLLHAAGLGRERYGPGDLERARIRLLAFLARHLSPAERERTTVVFDAAGAPPGIAAQNASAPHVASDLEVVFAPAGGDADAWIERLLLRHSSPRQVVVVSSDRRLRDAARRRRSQSETSEDFVKRMAVRNTGRSTAARPVRPAEPPGKFDGNTAGDSTDEWLAVFGTELPTVEETPASTKDVRSAKSPAGTSGPRGPNAAKPGPSSRDAQRSGGTKPAPGSDVPTGAPPDAAGLEALENWEQIFGDIDVDSLKREADSGRREPRTK